MRERMGELIQIARVGRQNLRMSAVDTSRPAFEEVLPTSLVGGTILPVSSSWGREPESGWKVKCRKDNPFLTEIFRWEL